jgi:hypothetical protein
VIAPKPVSYPTLVVADELLVQILVDLLEVLPVGGSWRALYSLVATSDAEWKCASREVDE